MPALTQTKALVLRESSPALGETNFTGGMTRDRAERIASLFYWNVTAVDPVRSKVVRKFSALLNGEYDVCLPCPVFYDICVDGFSQAAVGMLGAHAAILHKTAGWGRRLQVLDGAE